jgi:hypothetical protein
MIKTDVGPGFQMITGRNELQEEGAEWDAESQSSGSVTSEP